MLTGSSRMTWVFIMWELLVQVLCIPITAAEPPLVPSKTWGNTGPQRPHVKRRLSARDTWKIQQAWMISFIFSKSLCCFVNKNKSYTPTHLPATIQQAKDIKPQQQVEKYLLPVSWLPTGWMSYCGKPSFNLSQLLSAVGEKTEPFPFQFSHHNNTKHVY